MRGQGDLVFKSIEERPGGKFINDKGQEIEYQKCYILKLDEVTPKGIVDIKLKIPEDEKQLINTFKEFEPYTKIHLDFDLDCNGSNVKVIPTNVKKV